MHYVLDTCYLDVLFDIPGHDNAAAKLRVIERIAQIARAGGILYVPVPVIFEICNHIAHVADGHRRAAIAANFVRAVRSSLLGAGPWQITPLHGYDALTTWIEALESSITRFHADFVASQVGLTDVAIICEAEKLANGLTNYPQPRPTVHILTNDRALKAYEPDAEHDPIMW